MWMVPGLRDLRMNPNEIDLFINGWTGPMGAAVERGAEAVLRAQGVIGQDLAAQTWGDMPGFQRFLQRYPNANAFPIKKLFDISSEYDRVGNSLQVAMEAGDIGRFNQLIADSPAFLIAGISVGRGLNALVTVTGKNFPYFMQTIQEKLRTTDMASVARLMQIKGGMDQLRKVASIIERTETPEVRSVIESIVPSGKKGLLTADDKRQLLDRLYIGLQNAAEEAMGLVKTLEAQGR
jgi:hypothetical protein